MWNPQLFLFSEWAFVPSEFSQQQQIFFPVIHCESGYYETVRLYHRLGLRSVSWFHKNWKMHGCQSLRSWLPCLRDCRHSAIWIFSASIPMGMVYCQVLLCNNSAVSVQEMFPMVWSLQASLKILFYWFWLHQVHRWFLPVSFVFPYIYYIIFLLVWQLCGVALSVCSKNLPMRYASA